jgi:hypothetical protein
VYGEQRYPAQLVLQDVLTLHGSQFRQADCIVASPPCQEFSYMAMPWSRGKRIAAALRGQTEFPEDYAGSRTVAQLTALFDACLRIQREASEAAGRHVPMVVENVNGAQPWVGPARARFGSFYFWGDIANVGGRVVAGGLRFGQFAKAAVNGVSTESKLTASISTDACADGIKQRGSGPGWFDKALDERRKAAGGNKVRGDWFGRYAKEKAAGTISPSRLHGARSDSRKAASALIAKIPFPLASYIARAFKR